VVIPSLIMVTEYPRLEKRTLVEDFITRFEEMILTGKLNIGEKLPSERELAFKLGVSRPVVHDGLLDLATKGLITRFSSGGAVVNDYRRQGSLSLLTTLMNFRAGNLEPGLLSSTMDFRRLFEVESAGLAAIRRSQEQLHELMSIVDQEKNATGEDILLLSNLDFQFHHLVAMASGNIFYPLLLNSCRPLYANFASLFYAIPGSHAKVVRFHEELMTAIAENDASNAQAVMDAMLDHGYKSFVFDTHPMD
jgi:GntR family transcriptional regulator, transcriptional repressor for pyruvate dehydrogenase complex